MSSSESLRSVHKICNSKRSGRVELDKSLYCPKERPAALALKEPVSIV